MQEVLPRRLGRYQLIRKVASGGMATVYVGNMLGRAGFSRTVAIKVLHPHLASDPSFVAMFFDEARLAARIHHPNVVDVHDVDVIDGQLIIVMELIVGVPLSRAVKEAGDEALPIGLVGRVMVDALTGLHAAHELEANGELLGLVHRDISPQNILVGSDGITRIVDFGVAKAAGRLMTTGHEGIVKGKTSYLAPEQVAGERIDRRVDLFAAGAVLWECLVGRRLFRSDTTAETLGQLLTASIDPPSQHRFTVPIEVDEVCLRALERERDRRFATAKDFAEALREALGAKMFSSEDVRHYLLERAMVHHEAADSLPSLEEIGGPVALSPERLSRPPDEPQMAVSSIADAERWSHTSALTTSKDPLSRPRSMALVAAIMVLLGGAAGWLALRPGDATVLVAEPILQGGGGLTPATVSPAAIEAAEADTDGAVEPAGTGSTRDVAPAPTESAVSRPPPAVPAPPAPSSSRTKYKALDGL